MKYLKKFNESIGFKLDNPKGYDIVYNHKNGDKIMNFLEEIFGTTNNPLNEYKDPNDDDDHDSTYTYYGHNNQYRGDMIFLLSVNERMGDKVTVSDKVWDELEYLIKYTEGDSTYDELEHFSEVTSDILKWYINMIYEIDININCSRDYSIIGSVSNIYPKNFYLK